MKQVIFFGTYDVETTPRVQVLIEGLRSHDYEILQCNVPLKLSTAQRVAILKQPWRLPILLMKLASCWIRLSLKARRLPKDAPIIVGYLGQFDIHLAHALFRRSRIYLDYLVSGSDTAKDRRLSNGWKDRVLQRVDNAALRKADTVIVDTEEHRLALPETYNDKGLVIHVGASQRWFNARKQQSVQKPLRVVFFGKFTPLQGAPIIGEALNLVSQPMEVLMGGSGQDEAEAKELAKHSKVSVRWQPWVDAETISTYDVALGIFGSGPKALRVVPNKVYQAAALGCAVVTSDTPPQRTVLGTSALFTAPGDATALAKQLDYLAVHPNEVTRLQQEASKLADTDFTPHAIIQPLLRFL